MLQLPTAQRRVAEASCRLFRDELESGQLGWHAFYNMYREFEVNIDIHLDCKARVKGESWASTLWYWMPPPEKGFF